MAGHPSIAPQRFPPDGVQRTDVQRSAGEPATPVPAAGTFRDGRDEMNLADFPISVLQRRQPLAIHGGKLDSIVYEASRYDAGLKRRVPQRVTLTTSSRYGLPTPADENVILGLLYVAKHGADFATPRVHFCPNQLFSIMHWSNNSRSYQRLRDVLRRLKALTILYENAWWDHEGRGYEEEFATGIIAEYYLVSQTSGRRKAGVLPPSWVSWSPRFHESLKRGNLKRLDLDQLFKLKHPTSQRMYRFLDKRFYSSPNMEMDLLDFACGHIGLAPTNNVALIKQRLAPPIEELEEIGFIERRDSTDRYHKVAPRVWRIHLHKGSTLPEPTNREKSPGLRQGEQATENQSPHAPDRALKTESPEETVVQVFHRLRFGITDYQPLNKELAFARELLTAHSHETVQAILPGLARRLKDEWPEGKTFVAVKHYVADSIQLHERKLRAATAEQETRLREQRERAEESRRAEERPALRAIWEALPAEQRDEITRKVLATQPPGWEKNHPVLVERLCLYEVKRRQQNAIAAESSHATSPDAQTDRPPARLERDADPISSRERN